MSFSNLSHPRLLWSVTTVKRFNGPYDGQEFLFSHWVTGVSNYTLCAFYRLGQYCSNSSGAFIRLQSERIREVWASNYWRCSQGGFIASNAASCSACQSKGCAFVNSRKRGSTTFAKFGIKRRYQPAEPRKLRSLRIFRGAGISKMGASLLRSTLTPPPVDDRRIINLVYAFTKFIIRVYEI